VVFRSRPRRVSAVITLSTSEPFRMAPANAFTLAGSGVPSGVGFECEQALEKNLGVRTGGGALEWGIRGSLIIAVRHSSPLRSRTEAAMTTLVSGLSAGTVCRHQPKPSNYWHAPRQRRGLGEPDARCHGSRSIRKPKPFAYSSEPGWRPLTSSNLSANRPGVISSVLDPSLEVGERPVTESEANPIKANLVLQCSSTTLLWTSGVQRFGRESCEFSLIKLCFADSRFARNAIHNWRLGRSVRQPLDYGFGDTS